MRRNDFSEWLRHRKVPTSTATTTAES